MESAPLHRKPPACRSSRGAPWEGGEECSHLQCPVSGCTGGLGWGGAQGRLSGILELANESTAQPRCGPGAVHWGRKQKLVQSQPGAPGTGLVNGEGGLGLGFRKKGIICK